MRTLATSSVAAVLLILIGCGGTTSPVAPNGSLTGNWQLNMLQEFPGTGIPLSASGFLTQSNDQLTGSMQGPTILSANKQAVNCGGTAQITGTITGQSVTFAENLGGTVYNFTGAISSDNESMSGDYQAQGGACFTTPTTGTWNAFLIPQLTGSFTGEISASSYMAQLTGVSPAIPIAVSGSIAQSANAGASDATLTGTITALGYPCFTTASMTGTISGQNVYLDLYDYNGALIGTLGQPSGSAGTPGSPATVVVDKTGVSLVDTSSTGLFLGIFNGTSVVGPCPSLGTSNGAVTSDGASIALTFQ